MAELHKASAGADNRLETQFKSSRAFFCWLVRPRNEAGPMVDGERITRQFCLPLLRLLFQQLSAKKLNILSTYEPGGTPKTLTTDIQCRLASIPSHGMAMSIR